MCSHEDFTASVEVNRLVDTGWFVACIKIECAVCGEKFKFVGLPLGVSTDHPMMCPTGIEARLPIVPASKGVN